MSDSDFRSDEAAGGHAAMTGDTIPTDPRTAARRLGLREFQDALAERLRNAHDGPAVQNRLALRIGAADYLVDLPESGEIIAVPELMPVPWTKPWYRGLANVRGNLIGVIDLAQFMDAAPTPLDAGSRVLVFAPELGCNAGILVTRMLGLRSPAHWTAAEEAADSSHTPWIGASLRDPGGGPWQELRLAALARDERFLQIGNR